MGGKTWSDGASLERGVHFGGGCREPGGHFRGHPQGDGHGARAIRPDRKLQAARWRVSEGWPVEDKAGGLRSTKIHVMSPGDQISGAAWRRAFWGRQLAHDGWAACIPSPCPESAEPGGFSGLSWEAGLGGHHMSLLRKKNLKSGPPPLALAGPPCLLPLSPPPCSGPSGPLS